MGAPDAAGVPPRSVILAFRASCVKRRTSSHASLRLTSDVGVKSPSSVPVPAPGRLLQDSSQKIQKAAEQGSLHSVVNHCSAPSCRASLPALKAPAELAVQEQRRAVP